MGSSRDCLWGYAILQRLRLREWCRPWAIDGNDSPVSSLPNSPVTKVRKEPPHWQRSSWNGDKAADG